MNHQNNTRMNDEVLVRVNGVSKKFCRTLKRSLWYGLCDVASELNLLGKNSVEPESGSGNPDAGLRPGEFWAVRDVSFELRRGECIGLIGRNGAGKTTLLKLLNGLIKPDSGRIEMHGRVAALIALGAGFNPVLTGRENIYINASVLGLSRREIDEKFEEIVEFSELEEFIDSPVQSYSSGMQVRLGFSVATTLSPDVLILDEVLAVGDASFRHKCYHRINSLLSNAAVILVSHGMDYIGAVCRSVAMMRRGRTEIYDDPNEGIAAYSEENTDGNSSGTDGGKVIAFYPPVRSAKLRVLTPTVTYAGRLAVEVEFDCSEALSDVIFSFVACNAAEQGVMAWDTSRREGRINLQRGRQVLRFCIDPVLLHDGTYRWSFNLLRRESIEHVVWMMRAGDFKVTSTFRPLSNIPYLVDVSELELLSITE